MKRKKLLFSAIIGITLMIGMPNWAIAATVAELAPLFSSAAPPPLASPPPIQQQQQQVASSDGPQEPWGGSPAVAALLNSAFGIWSWGNHDTFGGVMTTLLQVGGLAAYLVGYNMALDQAMEGDTSAFGTLEIATYGGMVLFVGGTIFGVVRGVSQYNKKMKAYRSYMETRSFAEAIKDNPLNNISLVAFPTGDNRGVAGALTYSLSF